MTKNPDDEQVEHRGCRLSYHLSGDTGSPVLFIQGAGIHGDGWEPQTEALKSNYKCLTFDNRGIGRSQPCSEPLSIEQMAEDACVLLDHLGWDSAHVVGHSMGGLIALHLALSARKRVRSLALLCTFARGRDATRLTARMMWIGLRTRIGTRRSRRRAFLEMVMPPEALAGADHDEMAARFALIFGHDLAETSPVVMKQLAAMRAYDATPRLSELSDIPTLVVSGAHDLIATPESGRAIAAGIHGSQYVEFAEAAHGLPVQYPERLNNLLLEHFAQVDNSEADFNSFATPVPARNI